MAPLGVQAKAQYLIDVGAPAIFNALCDHLLAVAPPAGKVTAVLRDALDQIDREGGVVPASADAVLADRAVQHLHQLRAVADQAELQAGASVQLQLCAERWQQKEQDLCRRLADAIAELREQQRRIQQAAPSPRPPSDWGSEAGLGAVLARLRAAPQRQSVFTVRHGERLDEVDAGWTAGADRPYDPPLTEAGVATARALGARFATLGDGERPVCVVSSPFLRCIETAAAIAGALIAVNADDAAPCLFVYDALGEVHHPNVLKHTSPPEFSFRDLAEAARRVAPALTGGVVSLAAHGALSPAYPEEEAQALSRYSRAFTAAADALQGRSAVLVTHGHAVGVSVTDSLPAAMVYETQYCSYTQRSRDVNGGGWVLHTASGESGVQWLEQGAFD
eukprot:TRINITY_DN27679_c0_g1_i1.p1 TRINITY_DN27679_c0_g1~~TRINITY_DN27679_c0_g1_i1.p1  ORF type:complete len:392 (+),score=98.76 TRINITY_DN27679_c0_g1_i1:92-1267(+)